MSVVRSKYKVRDGWLQKEPINNASPIWRVIQKTQSLIIKGACYIAGDGASINVWLDHWVP